MSEDSVYDFGGLKFRVLFSKWGYAPHYAEHVIDPLDGKPKLVMADPHIRYIRHSVYIYRHSVYIYGVHIYGHRVYIYDPVKKEIEWEFKVPGQLSNPHIAHMVTDQNPITGPFWSLVADKIKASPGDIVCADGDNNLIVIDRERKNVKHVLKIPDSKWLHDIIPSVNGDGLIIDDYSRGWVRKIDFNAKTIWELNFEKICEVKLSENSTIKLQPCKASPCKMSTVYAKASKHEESYGGDYIVVNNSNPHGVYEISDEGELLWSCPSNPPCMNATWLYHPHSAFRTGLAEFRSNLTVIGLEGGGGIIAVDRECRPRWGFMKPHFNVVKVGNAERRLYRPSFHGFFQTTHVFPLLNGNIGAIDWRGKYSSQVVEIISFPSKTALYWLLAWYYPVSTNGVVFKPIEIGEWDIIAVQVVNNGQYALEYELLVSTLPQIYPEPKDSKQIPQEKLSILRQIYPQKYNFALKTIDKNNTIHKNNQVKPGETDLYVIDRNIYSVLLVKARAIEQETRVTIYITQKRY
ncbi:MAG: hypothetical protein QXR51_06525 [Desulfurococcaceae archaeon]